MSTSIHLLTLNQKRGEKSLFAARIADLFTGLSERFWFTLALFLFVVMGPFSVIAVIIGLYSLATSRSNREAAEPASL